jgi:hypothetical protein
VGVAADDRAALNSWWTSRAIPASRSGLRDALEALKISSPVLLLTKCFGLSLSDQYWVNAAAKPVRWEDVNFFENSFSEDVGDALFGKAREGGEISLVSPDNTSDGWLRKKWVIADGKRMLVKGGSAPFEQEPLNEVLASEICERLGVPHVPYALLWEDERPYSVCGDFITPQTELVSAWYLQSTQKRKNDISLYRHYVNCCAALGVPNALESLDHMLVLDYVIANEDRHLNNFGAVRDAETLEWLGAAPLFDCGTSMWFNQNARLIGAARQADAKPFRKTHAEQITLVSSFDFVDFSKLNGLAEAANELYGQSPYISDDRRARLCNALNRRVSDLERIARERRRIFPAQTQRREDDRDR